MSASAGEVSIKALAHSDFPVTYPSYLALHDLQSRRRASVGAAATVRRAPWCTATRLPFLSPKTFLSALPIWPTQSDSQHAALRRLSSIKDHVITCVCGRCGSGGEWVHELSSGREPLHHQKAGFARYEPPNGPPPHDQNPVRHDGRASIFSTVDVRRNRPERTCVTAFTVAPALGK